MSSKGYRVEYGHDGVRWFWLGPEPEGQVFARLHDASEQAVKSLLSGTGNRPDSHVRIREADTGKIVWSHNRADWPEGGSGA